MNFVAICLHSLDMRDFHSYMRDTPFLDRLRKRSVFIPMGRGHGHNNKDSINAEMTGCWTARHCDSQLTHDDFRPQTTGWLPRTLIEYLRQAGYDIFTCQGSDNMGTAAAAFMPRIWMKHEPERAEQFNTCRGVARDEILERIKRSDRFYAHLFLRETHRPWSQNEGLCALMGKPPAKGWPEDAFCARKAALDRPDEFAALRRRGLARADRIVQQIFEATADRDDVTYIVYSNHGEVFDHFRTVRPYRNDGANMIVGVSHGPYPYEVLYANMQMWVIPGHPPRTMAGVGRMVDYPATILDLAGLEHDFMDGESMLTAFRQGRFAARDRYAESGLAETGSCISMVRSDGFKLIAMNPEPLPAHEQAKEFPEYHRLAVFDLKADPYEYADIADSPHGQEVIDWAVNRHRELKERPDR